MLTSRRPASAEQAGRYLSFATVAMLMFGMLAAPASAASAPSAAPVQTKNASVQRTVPAAVADAAAPAAPVTVLDSDGPDDQPNQKDLNFMTVDYGGASVNVKWGWDDTATSGANTRDGCALFDSDLNGNADFAFCVGDTHLHPGRAGCERLADCR